jgi:cytidylate kinase
MLHLFRGRGQQKAHRAKERTATQVLPETMWTNGGNEPLPSGIPPEGSVVVTIARQLGSGGAEIGRIVAEESGLHYVDHQIIDEVARRLGVQEQQAARQDEYTAGVAERIIEAMQRSSPFTANYQALFDPRQQKSEQFNELAYLYLTQKVILELATQGNTLIVGRGSQFLLHGAPRTLHIYIFAPLPTRIDNVMRRFQVDRTRAAELIEQRDYERDAYLRRYYGSDGNQPGLYHLLINTGLFSFELAANLVQQALQVAKEIKK